MDEGLLVRADRHDSVVIGVPFWEESVSGRLNGSINRDDPHIVIRATPCLEFPDLVDKRKSADV